MKHLKMSRFQSRHSCNFDFVYVDATQILRVVGISSSKRIEIFDKLEFKIYDQTKTFEKIEKMVRKDLNKRELCA